jgi:hypothetical protein
LYRRECQTGSTVAIVGGNAAAKDDALGIACPKASYDRKLIALLILLIIFNLFSYYLMSEICHYKRPTSQASQGRHSP